MTFSRPVLRADVGHLRARAGDEIVHATGKPGGALITRAEMLDHGDLRQFVRDEKQMRENRHVVVSQPMKDLDRLFDLEPARHEQECSRRNERLVQRGELGRAERRFGRHEIFSEKIGVLDHCAFERLKNHAAFLQVFGDDIALDQLIVRKNHACGVLIEAAGILQNILAIVFRERTADFERRQIEKTQHWKIARPDLFASDSATIRIVARLRAADHETNREVRATRSGRRELTRVCDFVIGD